MTAARPSSIASSVASTHPRQGGAPHGRQASSRHPTESLTLLAVDDPSIAVHAGWAMPQVLEELAEEARAALEHARVEAKAASLFEAKLVEGDPLLPAGRDRARQATLVAVGSHGLSRAAGIALGAVSTHLLHEAPCSVLIARGAIDVAHWPRRIVVGVDGSPDSELALRVGRALAARFDSEVRAIIATQDAYVDLDAARRIAPGSRSTTGMPSTS